jgi:hypothetical protein
MKLRRHLRGALILLQYRGQRRTSAGSQMDTDERKKEESFGCWEGSKVVWIEMRTFEG